MVAVSEFQQEQRFAPELIEYFKEHKRMWEAGEIRLNDFAEDFKVLSDGTEVPKWYPGQLGEDVVFDKAKIFEIIGYNPFLPQCRFHASLKRTKLFSGGAGAGKSFSAAMELVPILLTPGTTSWLVGAKYEVCVFEFDYIYDAICHPAWGGLWEKRIEEYTRRPKQGHMIIKLFWPEEETFSSVEVKTAATDKNLLGVELQGCLLCEGSQLKEETVTNKLLMRVQRGGGVMLLPSSPNQMGWAADWYKAGIAGGDSSVFAVNCDSRMNPKYCTDEYLESLREKSLFMSDADFNEQVRGIPTSRFGMIYDTFDRFVHVETWDESWPKPSWSVARAVDFGFSDPFVVLWAAEDEDGRWYIFHEFYRTQQVADDVVRYIAEYEGLDYVSRGIGGSKIKVQRTANRRIRVNLPTVTDWDASQREELSRGGIKPIRKANKDVIEGIAEVNAALRVQGDGRPRLYIHPDCKELIRELASYEWDKDKPKRDQSDHAVDALRYLVATLSRRQRNATPFVLDF